MSKSRVACWLAVMGADRFAIMLPCSLVSLYASKINGLDEELAVQRFANRGVEIRPSIGLPGLNWDDVRVFLAVAETGSIKAASRDLSLTPQTVRRRIASLEKQMDALLISRTAAGADLTPVGRSVYSIAIEMRDHSVTLQNLSQRYGRGASGLVRLAVTEGLGAFWLMPHLVQFQRDNRQIKLDVRHDMRVPDLSRLECDVAVQLQRPTDESLVAVRLGFLHIMLFASADYIARHGSPRSLSELSKFDYVHFVAEQIPSHQLTELVQTDPQMRYVSMIVNTTTAQVLAMVKGGGFGALPTYTAALTKALVPVKTELSLKREVWLAYHREAGQLPRVRRLIDTIKGAFDPKTYPWFREDYVDPLDFHPMTIRLFE